MWVKRNRKFILSQNKQVSAFTLLEMLLSLFIIGLFLMTSNQLIGYQQRLQNSFSFKGEQEWHLALAQIEHRLKNYYCRSIYSNEVTFAPLYPKKDDLSDITLKKGYAGTRLYFEKKGGNEPLMTDVRFANFKKEGFGKLKMTITFYSGEVRNAYLLLNDQKS